VKGEGGKETLTSFLSPRDAGTLKGEEVKKEGKTASASFPSSILEGRRGGRGKEASSLPLLFLSQGKARDWGRRGKETSRSPFFLSPSAPHASKEKKKEGEAQHPLLDWWYRRQERKKAACRLASNSTSSKK